MVISGSQHPLKVDYSILKYITHLWVNKILVVVVVVGRVQSQIKIKFNFEIPVQPDSALAS